MLSVLIANIDISLTDDDETSGYWLSHGAWLNEYLLIQGPPVLGSPEYKVFPGANSRYSLLDPIVIL